MSEVISLLSKLPPGTLAAVLDLLRAIVSSDDPKRTAKRAAIAAASRTASEAAIAEALRAR